MTAPAPRVTVAISTWNRAHLVGRAVASAAAQTFADIEVLVVDDGSTDDTPQVLAQIHDPRLRIVRHEQNNGIGRTRNTAIAHARGEWLAFLDDDNEWTPQYLERQLAFAAARPDAGVIYCRARRIYDDSGRETIMPAVVWEGRVLRRLLRGWMPLMSCALFRHATLKDAGGFDESLRATEDHDLWLRLAQRTDFAGTSDTLVVRHEHHGAQLSRNHVLLRRDVTLLDGKWRATLTSSCGWAAYRRWRAGIVTIAELPGAMQAVEQGSPIRALPHVWRIARHLPWSAPGVARGTLMLAIGATAYRRLVRMQSKLWRLPADRSS